MLQRAISKNFLGTLEHIEFGSLSVETPEGKRYQFVGRHAGAQAALKITDWRAVSSFAAKGDVGLAEAYRDGWLETEDLVSLLSVGLQNEATLERYIYGGFFAQFAAKVLYFFRRNTVKGSARNIHAHYDLGNDFYSLWLDPSMTYSSGIFTDTTQSLDQAQYNKYNRILQRLDHKPGNLLEVGCGWGGFAEHALDHVDMKIKGITISEQQHHFALQRLATKASIVREDYRQQTGQYDHIVSIEMFEAVGEKYWPEYFRKMKALLKEKGKAVVQTISIADRYFERYRKTGDMIRTFIFPGGMLPSNKRFRWEAKKAGLRVTDEFAFGRDYATTLSHWLETFEQRLPEVKALNFDDKFVRIWRFYLAVCIAGFLSERTDVVQFELQHEK